MTLGEFGSNTLKSLSYGLKRTLSNVSLISLNSKAKQSLNLTYLPIWNHGWKISSVIMIGDTSWVKIWLLSTTLSISMIMKHFFNKFNLRKLRWLKWWREFLKLKIVKKIKCSYLQEGVFSKICSRKSDKELKKRNWTPIWNQLFLCQWDSPLKMILLKKTSKDFFKIFKTRRGKKRQKIESTIEKSMRNIWKRKHLRILKKSLHILLRYFNSP